MSTRAPQRCIKCSKLSGMVVLRRGHRCPSATGSEPATTPSAILPSIPTTTAVPLITLSDVHHFDTGTISDFGIAPSLFPIPDELFHFPKWACFFYILLSKYWFFFSLDLNGLINLSSDSSLDPILPWFTKPPLSPVDQSPLESTSDLLCMFFPFFQSQIWD